MNLLELRTETRRLMSEASTTNSYCSDTDLNRFIYDAIKDMCIKARVYQRTRTTTVSNNVASYTCPLDFIEPLVLLNPSGSPIHLKSIGDIGGLFLIAGKPTWYYLTVTSLVRTTRANGTTYTIQDILLPAAANGFMYEVTTAGDSGGAPPAYPTNPGSSVTDGTCVLTCRELTPTGWGFTLVDTPTTAGGGTGTYTMIYSAMDEGLFVDTDSPNFPAEKHHNICLFACHKWAVKRKNPEMALSFLNQYNYNLGLPLIGVPGVQPNA